MEPDDEYTDDDNADGDNGVCSFCGVGNSMHREVRRKTRHIAALERELATVKGDGASAQEAKAVAAAHYAQLQQMQESCAMRLAVMEEVERRLADAEAQLEDAKAEAARAAKAEAESQTAAAAVSREREREREEWSRERERWYQERDAARDRQAELEASLSRARSTLAEANAQLAELKPRLDDLSSSKVAPDRVACTLLLPALSDCSCAITKAHHERRAKTALSQRRAALELLRAVGPSLRAALDATRAEATAAFAAAERESAKGLHSLAVVAEKSLAARRGIAGRRC